MTPLAEETAVIGAYLLAGEIVYLGFLAVKRNYLKGSASLSITPPDARQPKPPQPAPKAAAVTETKPLREVS